jgi:hypothetical protein
LRRQLRTRQLPTKKAGTSPTFRPRGGAHRLPDRSSPRAGTTPGDGAQISGRDPYGAAYMAFASADTVKTLHRGASRRDNHDRWACRHPPTPEAWRHGLLVVQTSSDDTVMSPNCQGEAQPCQGRSGLSAGPASQKVRSRGVASKESESHGREHWPCRETEPLTCPELSSNALRLCHTPIVQASWPPIRDSGFHPHFSCGWGTPRSCC